MSEDALAVKLAVLRPHLDERQWRLLLGAEAVALGRGGIALVARLSGASRTTVQAGVGEVRAGVVPDGRVRAPGAGRPSVEQAQPGLVEALDALVSPETRGDPMSPLRWTTKSLAQLTKALYGRGFTVSKKTVGRLLKQAGYRLQAVFKTKEGASHPDRDAQFAHINALAGVFLDGGDPVISVDTKKKELVGEYAKSGREWQPAGYPVEVNGHDFPSGVPKAIPFGVYDLGADDGFVTVGVDHDTAAFAVNAIRTWWDTIGRERYPRSSRLLVTADCGGSNGNRLRAFKVELAAFAAQAGLQITVCHFPPGTSKWNKVEHRLFSFISMNWRGRPLTDYQVVIETIAATTTETGLTVAAVMDTNTYPTGIRISDAQIKAGEHDVLAAATWTPWAGGWEVIGYRSIGGGAQEDLMPVLRHEIGWLLPIHAEHLARGTTMSGDHPLGPLITTWLLIAQQMAETMPAKLPMTITKVHQRSQRPAPDVRTMQIRPRRATPPEPVGAVGTPTRAKPDHRFWVSGHERQQAYGPGRSLRRAVEIQPFLKGGDDLPIKLSTTVRILGTGTHRTQEDSRSE